jgi:limonene-1,2-epoxide hydrolase
MRYYRVMALAVGLYAIAVKGESGMSYVEAMARTESVSRAQQGGGSAAATVALERIRALYADLSEEAVRRSVRDVYAEDVWFNDTLKTVEGVEALEAYLLKTARAVKACRVSFTDVAASGDEYYLRWVMTVEFRKGGKAESIGMTHVRFDKDGKVVLHQDYWDSAAGLYEHLPVVGWAIRAVKKRL